LENGPQSHFRPTCEVGPAQLPHPPPRSRPCARLLLIAVEGRHRVAAMCRRRWQLTLRQAPQPRPRLNPPGHPLLPFLAPSLHLASSFPFLVAPVRSEELATTSRSPAGEIHRRWSTSAHQHAPTAPPLAAPASPTALATVFARGKAHLGVSSAMAPWPPFTTARGRSPLCPCSLSLLS
jgi:hypothetical protein